MIKIKYPSDLETLKKKYWNLFAKSSLEKEWSKYKKFFGEKISLKDLIVGDFPFLVDIYLHFKSLTLSDVQKDELKDIFDYNNYHDKIAGFFMDKDNGIELHTCHYCNTAYINAYGIGTTYHDNLAFVNNASIDEWRTVFKESILPDDTIKRILNDRPFASLKEFNNNRYLYKGIEKYKGMSLYNANHFDLDHLLPKSKCPIVGLSLFNFVPSCQVCNEKLKGDKELATSKDAWLKISPTFMESTLCDDMIIKIIPEFSCTTFFDLRKNNSNYRLSFEPQNVEVYNNYIQTFRLQDRYNYHKELALHILDLKERYPEEKRKEISKLLSGYEPDSTDGRYSELQINEDIFEVEFSKDRCFSKLRNDMLKHN